MVSLTPSLYVSGQLPIYGVRNFIDWQIHKFRAKSEVRGHMVTYSPSMRKHVLMLNHKNQLIYVQENYTSLIISMMPTEQNEKISPIKLYQEWVYTP